MSTATAGPMTMARRTFDSTIGQKFVMAATGFVLVAFILVHLIGNLQVFIPLEPGGLHPMNRYAHFLKHTEGLIWIVRLVMLASFFLHVRAGIILNRRNRAARPIAYARSERIAAGASSYHMVHSGIVILLFVLYHLAHYTLGIAGTRGFDATVTFGGVAYQDVYHMVILGFRDPIVAGIYIVANIVLGLHLNHAASSMFQTLGWRVGGAIKWVDRVGPTIATVVIAGNVAIPLAILLHVVGG